MNTTQILFGRDGDWLDRHQAACMVCVLVMISTIDALLEMI